MRVNGSLELDETALPPQTRLIDVLRTTAGLTGTLNLDARNKPDAVWVFQIGSALTTASGFGSLWLSSHPGTASMGELLMISLFWTLVTTLFVSPALLGPPPPREHRAHEKLI